MKKWLLLMMLFGTSLFAFCSCSTGEASSLAQKMASATVGDYIIFGSYEQDNDTSNGKEAIEWLVLAKESNRLLVISRYGIECLPFNNETEKLTPATWETCTLRKWLNDDFLSDAFSSVEQQLIPSVTVSADRNTVYNTDAGNATKDKIFLLSIPEVEKYFGSNSAQQCEPTTYVKKQSVYLEKGFCMWWLRTPGQSERCAATVDGKRGIMERGYLNGSGDAVVRPAFWIDLKP